MATLGYNAAVGYDDAFWYYDGAMVAAPSAPGSVQGAIQTALRAVPGYLDAATATLQAALRSVPGVLGVTWYYRRLTSGPTAETRTYGTQATFVVLVTGRTTLEDYNESGEVWRRVERARLRTSDALADLHQGDQVIDASGNFWAVMGIESSGIGTEAYRIERHIPLAASPNRHGGV
jgi:hypothetical protein